VRREPWAQFSDNTGIALKASGTGKEAASPPPTISTGGAPQVKKLLFRPIPDDAVRAAALQNGEVDVAVNIPPHLAIVIANDPKLFRDRLIGQAHSP
jgi:ABC-type transport system substrate-binding protein